MHKDNMLSYGPTICTDYIIVTYYRTKFYLRNKILDQRVSHLEIKSGLSIQSYELVQHCLKSLSNKS